MAELVVTEEEGRAPSYLDWSDEALGKLVRYLAIRVDDLFGAGGFPALAAFAAAVLIDAAKSRGCLLTITVRRPQAEWTISVTRDKRGEELHEAE